MAVIGKISDDQKRINAARERLRQELYDNREGRNEDAVLNALDEYISARLADRQSC